jgi:hypothetical protein
VVKSNEMEQRWEYECGRGREWWEEVRVLLCAPPLRLMSLSFLFPIDETPPWRPRNWRCPKLPIGGFRRCSTDRPRQQCCNYRVASDRGGLARSSVRRRHSDDIHILHLFLRGRPVSQWYGLLVDTTWKHLDTSCSPHRVATVAREPKPQRATKARNHSIDCIGQTATVTLMSRGEFQHWNWKHIRD